MQEERGRVRIRSKSGTDYTVTEPFDDVVAMLESAEPGEWLVLTSIHGQRLFGTERTWLRADEIQSVQEESEAAWAWSCQWAELHYARQMADLENSSAQQIADAQVKIADRLGAILDGDDE